MRRNQFLILLCATALMGCATVRDSKINPSNWFDADKAKATEETAIKPLVPERTAVQMVDSRPLIAKLTELEVANVLGGVLVTATGTSDQMGAFNVELVPMASKAGERIFAFRVQYPMGATVAKQSVTAAVFLSNTDLAGVRSIRVTSASNALTRRY